MVVEINHVYEKLDLKIEEKEYSFRLDVTKKIYGGCWGKKRNQKMISEDIKELRAKKGFLEAKVVDGTSFKKWTKVGDFSEETADYIQGFGKHNLILKIENKIIYIEEFFPKEGDANVNVTVAERSNRYEQWKCSHVKNFSMTKNG